MKTTTVLSSNQKIGAKKGVKGFFRQVLRHKLLLLMLLPALVYVILFSYLPMFGVVLAFKDFNYRDGILGSPWAGFDNFKFLFVSNKLWPLTRNTLLYNLAFIVFGMFFEVSFAILINELGSKFFKKFSQTLMFLPYFISWVVVAAMVQAFFSYEHGIVNNFIESIGLSRVNIYSNPNVWPFLLVFFRIWKNTGYGSVVYLAAVTGIDPGIYEAAEIDGANVWQRIIHITLPCLKGTMMIMFLLAVGAIFRGDFGLFYQLVGNNGQILGVADILDTFIYRALITSNDIGMSSASGLYQSVLCFVTIITVNGIIKKIDPDYTLF